MREVNEEGEGKESGSEDKNGEINDNEDGDTSNGFGYAIHCIYCGPLNRTKTEHGFTQ
jgi:hypothetical protein